MADQYVEYPLQHGYVAHWLVAGPQATAIQPSRFVQAAQADANSLRTFRDAIFRRYHMAKAGARATPVERGPVGTGQFTIGKQILTWNYHPIAVDYGSDHAVDHSGYYAACHFLRSWAYVELVSERPQSLSMVLTAYGPIDVWVGDKHLPRTPDGGGDATTHTLTFSLGKGVTPLLVRFENVGMGHVAHAMSLRMMDASGQPATGVHSRFRTLIEEVARRNAFEKLSAAAFVERDVYAGETPLFLRWPEGRRASCFAHVRLQTPDGRIFLAGDTPGGAGDKLAMGHATQFPMGPMQATLMPNPNEVYLHHLRIARALPLWSLGRQSFHTDAWGDIATRRNEALLVAARLEEEEFSVVARMAWGAWGDVDADAFLRLIKAVQRREARSHLALLALLGSIYRWGEHEQFPAEVSAPLEAAALNYRYWHEDAGFDLLDFQHENHALIFHTCELLAGQRYSDHTFGDGQSGAWHRARAEALIKAWITAYGAHGMAAWNAPQSMEQAVAALTHVCDLAESPDLAELATVALDKVFFTLALHSWRGVWGAAGQRVPASVVKSGLLQPTAPVCNLMWGLGIFNHHTLGVVSLACCTSYQMPALFEQIALEHPEEIWGQEQHTAHKDDAPANVVTYATPDFMLSSVQDYHAGARGREELLWQATLGAEQVIFANHPGSSSENDSRAPGYWAGNGRLPRIAQWKDALIALYQLAADDLFTFTHAYFPTATFDEYVIQNNWAFARVGNGFMAVTNSQPLVLTAEGRYALRELRAEGSSQLWLVQMGRAARDGSFAAFQQKVLARQWHYADGAVEYTTIGGDTLHFDWEGPLLVNGDAVSNDFPHYQNPYTTTPLGSTTMVIARGEEAIQLDFSLDSGDEA